MSIPSAFPVRSMSFSSEEPDPIEGVEGGEAPPSALSFDLDKEPPPGALLPYPFEFGVDDCPITFETIEDQREARYLPCGHVFSREGLRVFFEARPEKVVLCPCCRKESEKYSYRIPMEGIRLEKDDEIDETMSAHHHFALTRPSPLLSVEGVPLCALTQKPLDKEAVRLPCSHVFNAEALRAELKGDQDSSCPCCKRSFSNQDILPFISSPAKAASIEADLRPMDVEAPVTAVGGVAVVPFDTGVTITTDLLNAVLGFHVELDSQEAQVVSAALAIVEYNPALMLCMDKGLYQEGHSFRTLETQRRCELTFLKQEKRTPETGEVQLYDSPAKEYLKTWLSSPGLRKTARQYCPYLKMHMIALPEGVASVLQQLFDPSLPPEMMRAYLKEHANEVLRYLDRLRPRGADGVRALSPEVNDPNRTRAILETQLGKFSDYIAAKTEVREQLPLALVAQMLCLPGHNLDKMLNNYQEAVDLLNLCGNSFLSNLFEVSQEGRFSVSDPTRASEMRPRCRCGGGYDRYEASAVALAAPVEFLSAPEPAVVDSSRVLPHISLEVWQILVDIMQLQDEKLGTSDKLGMESLRERVRANMAVLTRILSFYMDEVVRAPQVEVYLHFQGYDSPDVVSRKKASRFPPRIAGAYSKIGVEIVNRSNEVLKGTMLNVFPEDFPEGMSAAQVAALEAASNCLKAGLTADGVMRGAGGGRRSAISEEVQRYVLAHFTTLNKLLRERALVVGNLFTTINKETMKISKEGWCPPCVEDGGTIEISGKKIIEIPAKGVYLLGTTKARIVDPKEKRIETVINDEDTMTPWIKDPGLDVNGEELQNIESDLYSLHLYSSSEVQEGGVKRERVVPLSLVTIPFNLSYLRGRSDRSY